MLNLTAKSSISKMATSCGSCGSRLAGCGGGGEASGLTDETLTPGLAAAAEPASQAAGSWQLVAGSQSQLRAAGRAAAARMCGQLQHSLFILRSAPHILRWAWT